MTPGFVYSSERERPDVTCAMDRTGAYSPNDRRRPSLFAFCNSVVWKSWLFLSPGQPDEDRLHVFYRIDAAEAEMVHKKILQTIGPIYKSPETSILFPGCQSFLRQLPVKQVSATIETDKP